MSADPRIGTEVSGYRIERLLGRGGMSVVYLAEDLALERKVALKLLAPELAEDERFRERFLRESRLAASIDHPNIVPIYEAGEAEEVLYIAMRYVEGTDLRALLQDEGALSPARALVLASQVADALDTAHERGLVHRDVKPSNVLIASRVEREHCYLGDFGLTKSAQDRSGLTVSGQVVGTIDYVAPEQIKGGPLDGRTDVYALGCLLFESLSGEPPFRRESEVATLYAHLEEEPPRLSERRPELPGSLDAVLAKAMAKEPGERYPTCEELVAAAQRELGLSGELAPVAAPPRRSRLQLLAALVVILLLAAGTAAGLVVAFTDGSKEVETGDRLLRIDPATNEVVESIPVGGFPSSVAVGAGHVWVTSFGDGTLTRIDPDTGEAVTAETNSGHDVAVDGSIAYVADAVGVTRFAVASVAPQDSVETFRTSAISGGEEGVWIGQGENTFGLSVARLGPVFGSGLEPVVPVPIGERSELEPGTLWDVAVGEGAVWVVSDAPAGLLWRVDPNAGELAATIVLPSAPGWVATGAGAVWVSSPLDDVVWRIDPASNEIAATIEVGRGAAGVAAGAEGVWVANAIDGTVSRIDPELNEVVATVPTGELPVEVAVGDGAVWVADQPSRGLAGEEAALDIGHLSDCSGFAQFYGATVAGAELPLLQRGGERVGPELTDGVAGVSIGGRPLRLVFGCSFGSPIWGLVEARRLVERVGVEVLVGPLVGSVGMAVREYAKRHPEVTFVNGIAGAQSATLRDPAPSFFRFSADGAQWDAGLGSYAYHELGWRRAAVIEDDYDWAYLQSAGFIAEFCSLGGEIVQRIQRPILTTDYSSALAEIRDDADGVFASVQWISLEALASSGGTVLDGEFADRVVGASTVFLGLPEGAQVDDRLVGVVTANSVPRDLQEPTWERYVSDFREAFPDLIATQPEAGVTETLETTPFAIDYYNAMEAVLQALKAVDGELSDGQRRFQAALAELKLDSPVGRITLDENRQAIRPVFLERLEQDEQGTAVVRTFRTVENVEQTFNGYFTPDSPPPGPDEPECRQGNPPPWAIRSGS